jgi:hypothetical protein
MLWGPRHPSYCLQTTEAGDVGVGYGEIRGKCEGRAIWSGAGEFPPNNKSRRGREWSCVFARFADKLALVCTRIKLFRSY